MTLFPDQLRTHGLPDEALQPMPDIFGVAPAHEPADFSLGTRDGGDALRVFASRFLSKTTRSELQKAIATPEPGAPEQPVASPYKQHTVVNEHGKPQFTSLPSEIGTFVPFQADPTLALDAALVTQTGHQSTRVRHVLQCLIRASQTTFAISTIGKPRQAPTHLRVAYVQQTPVLGSDRSWPYASEFADTELFFGNRRFLYAALGLASIKRAETRHSLHTSDPQLRPFHAAMYITPEGIELHPGIISDVSEATATILFGSGGTQFCAPWSRRSSVCLQGENRIT